MAAVLENLHGYPHRHHLEDLQHWHTESFLGCDLFTCYLQAVYVECTLNDQHDENCEPIVSEKPEIAWYTTSVVLKVLHKK